MRRRTTAITNRCKLGDANGVSSSGAGSLNRAHTAPVIEIWLPDPDEVADPGDRGLMFEIAAHRITHCTIPFEVSDGMGNLLHQTGDARSSARKIRPRQIDLIGKAVKPFACHFERKVH